MVKAGIAALFLIIVYTFFVPAYNLSKSGHIQLTGETTKLSTSQVSRVYMGVEVGGTVFWTITNSPGGKAVEGTIITEVIRKQHQYRQIQTIFNVKGYCHSMCALLMSTGQKLYTNDDTPFIFHTVQTLFLGPRSHGITFNVFMHVWGPWLRTVLSEREMEALVNKQDIVVTGKRLKAIINKG